MFFRYPKISGKTYNHWDEDPFKKYQKTKQTLPNHSSRLEDANVAEVKVERGNFCNSSSIHINVTYRNYIPDLFGKFTN